MPTLRLPRHTELTAASRLAVLTSPSEVASAREFVLLALAGVTAAFCSTFLDLNVKVPGHAVLRSVFPMALGLALAPRKGGGVVMGLSAGVTVLAMRLGLLTGHGPGLGAMTSLLACGPLLDAALWRARAGWQLWLGFAAAGLGANVIAFLVRGGAKAGGGHGAATLPAWLQVAPLTYAACGLAAGLLSGMVWFAYRRRLPGDGP